MTGARGFFRGQNRLWAMFACGLLAAAGALAVRGQITQMATVTINGQPGAEEETDTGGFQIIKVDSKTRDKLDDFKRYCDKKSWELAFKTMNSLADSDESGMVKPEKGAFWFPLRRKVALSLAEMPEDGRQAYQLFYDPQARELWDRIIKPKAGGGATVQELASLQKIVAHYFFTSVGDLAADRLGDMLFERGDFAGAEAAWASVTRDYPDGHVSIPKVQVKRCVALMRLERREELEALTTRVAEKYGDEKVTIGGREVAAGTFARGLLAELPQISAATGPATPATADAEPDLGPDGLAWQIRVTPKAALTKMDSGVRNRGWGYSGVSFAGVIPGAAADDKRVYINWFGILYAADVETGKILWRTGKFADVTDRALNLVQNGVDFTKFPVRVSDGKVYSVVQDSRHEESGFQLACYDGATGNALWRSAALGGNSSMPFIQGNQAYCIGATGGDSTAYLFALNMDNGSIAWRLLLGKMQAGTNYRGNMNVPDPAMVVTPGMLYVSINNGALLAVNTAQRRIEWAFKGASKPWIDSGYGITSFETAPTLMLNNGTLYLKDSGAKVLYAIDPAEPAMKWQRDIDAGDTITSIDGSTATLLGNWISQLDLNNRSALSWSAHLQLHSGQVQPIITKNHIYVSTLDGICDLDLHPGADKTVSPRQPIFHEKNYEDSSIISSGGRLILAGGRMISVTDEAISAYRLKPGAKP